MICHKHKTQSDFSNDYYFTIMYNIEELSSMSEAKLKDLAKSMGLKKIESAPKDDLIYQIIDQQAIDAASNDPEPPKRRRGRAKKESKAANEAAKDKQVDSAKAEKTKDAKETKKAKKNDAKAKPESKADESEAETAAPKRKRGRPRKSEQKTAQIEQLPGLEESVQDKEADTITEQDTVTQAPAKRPKRERIERNVVQDEPNLDVTAELTANGFEQQPEQPIQPIQQDFNENSNKPMPDQEQEFEQSEEFYMENGPFMQDMEMMDEQASAPSRFDPDNDDFMSLFNTNPNASIGKKQKRAEALQQDGGKFYGSPMTFKPRTPQEREEAARRAEEQRRIAAEEAAKAPILSQEPKAEKEQQPSKQ